MADYRTSAIWYTPADYAWYTLADCCWYSLADASWYIIVRSLTPATGYWDITLQHDQFFDLDAIRVCGSCPFAGGANQLWRNQLLGLAIESSDLPTWPYSKVYFSVVHHPCNRSLAGSMQFYRGLLRSRGRFFSFTSDVLVRRAKQVDDTAVRQWANWYEGLYALS